jgi:hypothetical protein
VFFARAAFFRECQDVKPDPAFYGSQGSRQKTKAGTEKAIVGYGVPRTAVKPFNKIIYRPIILN